MDCPACNIKLVEVSVDGIKLDLCKNGCGGIWFDRFQLEKLDDPQEFSDNLLREKLAVKASVEHDQSKKRKCPRCKDVVMMKNYFSVKKEVKVDHCPKCAGHWLDEGKLFKIREQFKSKEERKQATAEFFSKVFGNDLSTPKK